MKARLAILGAALALWPLSAMAVTQENFHARTTQDLVELCSAGPSDPMRDAAIHFCHGYLLGAYHYHISDATATNPIVCWPNPAPSRDQAVRAFIDWARANRQYWNERGVDTMARWLDATYPCRS